MQDNDADLRRYLGQQTAEDIVREVSADFGKRLAAIMGRKTKGKSNVCKDAS